MAWIKYKRTFLLKSATFIFLLLFWLSIANLILLKNLEKILADGTFPRGWLNNIDSCYQTLYQHKEHQDSKLKVAVMGDSYGAGSGDEFLNGKVDYGIFHKIETNIIFRNYSRGGYGTLSSIKEYLFCRNALNNDIFFEKKEKENYFLMLIYMGNDLHDNLRYVTEESVEDSSVVDFTKSQLESSNNYRLLRFYTPLFTLIGGIASAKLKKVKNLAKDHIGHEFAQVLKNKIRVAFGKEPQLEQVSLRSPENKILFGTKELSVKFPLQTTGLDLSEDEKRTAIELINTSLENFIEKTKMKGSIIIIPSVASLYDWKDPILFYDYIKQKNLISKNKDEEMNNRLRIEHEIENIAIKNALTLISTYEKLKNLSLTKPIHGPIDWLHFNEDGYKVISDVIANHMHDLETTSE